jgi:hypothetical protein
MLCSGLRPRTKVRPQVSPPRLRTEASAKFRARSGDLRPTAFYVSTLKHATLCPSPFSRGDDSRQ